MKIWWYMNTDYRETHFMKGRSGLFKLLAANTCFLTFCIIQALETMFVRLRIISSLNSSSISPEASCPSHAL